MIVLTMIAMGTLIAVIAIARLAVRAVQTLMATAQMPHHVVATVMMPIRPETRLIAKFVVTAKMTIAIV